MPRKMTKDFAWSLGLMYGDGSVAKDAPRMIVQCANDQPDIKDKYVTTIKELFNYDCTYTDQKKGCITVRINSRHIIDFLQVNNVLKQKCHELVFPQLILDSSKEIQNAFVAGVWDADGGISLMNYKKMGLTLTQIYINMTAIDFVEQIEKLLECQFRSELIEKHDGGRDQKKIYVNPKDMRLFLDQFTESVKVQNVTALNPRFPKDGKYGMHRFTHKDGTVIEANMTKFCKDNGYSCGNFSNVKNGKLNSAYGFVKIEQLY